MAGDLEAFAEALEILLTEPGASETETILSNPDLVVILSASNGLWTAEGATLSEGRLVLPVGASIALEVTATDLLYEMTFPELNFSFDAIPGRIGVYYIEFEKAGLFEGNCSYTCGLAGAPLLFDVREPQ